MNKEQAENFANSWIDAWNSHDIERILWHYHDDFEMSSPVIVESGLDPSGRLKGKPLVREYWCNALQRYPELSFEKQHVHRGAKSIALTYMGVRGLSVEVFHFNEDGKIVKAFAHYDTW